MLAGIRYRCILYKSVKTAITILSKRLLLFKLAYEFIRAMNSSVSHSLSKGNLKKAVMVNESHLYGIFLLLQALKVLYDFMPHIHSFNILIHQ